MRRVPVLQLARFGAVGASNTLLSFVVYALALRLGVRYLPAGPGAFAVGGVNGFVLNRSWTFGSRGSVVRAGSRYAVVQAVGLLANLVLLRLAGHHDGLETLPSQRPGGSRARRALHRRRLGRRRLALRGGVAAQGRR
jgi:putative flippase GtrA